MKPCKKCSCKCQILEPSCLGDYIDIKDPDVIQPSHYTKATRDLKDLLGRKCALELCEALKQAAEDLEAAPVTPSGANPQLEDFIPSKWLAVINEQSFRMWYAHKLLFYFLEGASTSSVEAAGLSIVGASNLIGNPEYAIAQGDELSRWKKAANKEINQSQEDFKKDFWHPKYKEYPCVTLPCGCSCKTTCNKHGKGKRNSSKEDFLAIM